jgi:hypothetical protein
MINPLNHHPSMKTAHAPNLLTRYEYLALARHIQRDLERYADGTFYKLDPTTGRHIYNERDALIVEKALRKIRDHLLTVERQHLASPTRQYDQ